MDNIKEDFSNYWNDVRQAIRAGLRDIGIGEDCDIHILRKIQALPYRALKKDVNVEQLSDSRRKPNEPRPYL